MLDVCNDFMGVLISIPVVGTSAAAAQEKHMKTQDVSVSLFVHHQPTSACLPITDKRKTDLELAGDRVMDLNKNDNSQREMERGEIMV